MGTTSVCEETTSSVSFHYDVNAEVIIFYEDGILPILGSSHTHTRDPDAAEK